MRGEVQGQAAILLARAYPDRRPGKKTTSSDSEKVSSTRLSYARLIEDSPRLAAFFEHNAPFEHNGPFEPSAGRRQAPQARISATSASSDM